MSSTKNAKAVANSANETAQISESNSKNYVGTHLVDRLFKGVAAGCGMLILLVLTAVAVFLLFRALPLLSGNHNQVSHVFADFTGGKAHDFISYVAPLIFGTVLMSALALLFAFLWQLVLLCLFRIMRLKKLFRF